MASPPMTTSALPLRKAFAISAATVSAGRPASKSILALPSLRSMWPRRSVRVMPGTIRTTPTPNRAISPRNASVKPHRANLLAEYSGHAGIPRRPHIDDTFTMAGSFPFVRCGIAKWINSAGARKLTSMTRRLISSVESAKWPQLATPALFTSTSRPPSCSTAVRMTRRRSAASATSATTGRT